MTGPENQTLDYNTVFQSMGCHVRLVVGPAWAGHLPAQDVAAAEQRRWIEDFARRMTRFDPDSELSRFNRDPRETVPASPLLRAAVRAGVWAAERSQGLVDPTLVDALATVGYGQSRVGVKPVDLLEALADAPARRPAAAHARRRWREIEVDDEAEVIRRPPGLQFDTGGTGKGLAADAVAHRLSDRARFAVDCGGDMTLGGADPQRARYPVQVEHPLTGQPVLMLRVSEGGVATSGLSTRIWRRADRSPAHHLLDPSTGEPAWTGLVGATALAPTALEAETLAKMALLSGPERAGKILSEYGGVVFSESGDFAAVGPLPVQQGVHVRVPALGQ